MWKKIALVVLMPLPMAAATYADTDPAVELLPGAIVANAITQGAPGSGAPGSLNGTATWDGVTRLVIDDDNDASTSAIGCSGSLLWTRRDILTAAHCVAGMLANGGSLTADFLGLGGAQSFASSTATIFAGYTGAVTDTRDIAIIRLDTQVNGVSAYDIFRPADGSEISQTVSMVGYGFGGDGGGYTTGFGDRRAADNRVDLTWAGNAGGFNQLGYDFDAYGDASAAAYDTFGNCAGIVQTGVADEGMFIFGDSGGASFIDGKIAGVHSFAGFLTSACATDYTAGINGSWGEIMGDVRVSQFAAWVDETVTVPEPGSAVLILLGLAAIWVGRRNEV